MSSGNFFSELKRRNVYKVAVAYLVAGWALAQGLAQVLPVFDVPNWAIRLLIVLLVFGFPIALSLAWVYEITPEGIKRTEDVDPRKSIRRRTGRKIVALTIGLAAVALAVTIIRLPHAREQTEPAASGTLASEHIPAKSIAVLPFENLSSDKENAYFADGIQDEILTKLASIADLKVISRISTAKYKSKPEDLRTVSGQLGVATVLEGTVQRVADKVRVNVQLIDARSDTHLWAKTYDRDLRDVFAVESEVSQEIADALQAKLSPDEANTLAAAPTKDPEAYDLFLRGEFEQREAESLRRPAAFDRAAEWYKQAMVHDPGFSLAIARLAYSQMTRHWWVRSLVQDELNRVKGTAEDALRLTPNLPEGHVALGTVYLWGYRQLDRALAEFQRAAELRPNDAVPLNFLAATHRRQAAWERSLSEYEKAQRLDPRNPIVAASIGTTYNQLRVWKEAGRAAAHALALDPRSAGTIPSVLTSALNGTGDIKEARRIMSSFPGENRITSRSYSFAVVGIIGERAYLSVLERDFATALKIWEPRTNDTATESELGPAARLAIHVLAGDTATNQAESEKVRDVLETALRKTPDDLNILTQLSWTYLALGQKAEALKAAQQATNILPVEKDAINGTSVLTNLAQVEAHAGETGEAIKILQHLLSISAGMEVSLARLRIDPVWDPIRSDPPFQQLLAGKEHVGP
jgi:TolB-like protein/cytochrome c-type biogenesis protein CcmH/NrfG